jgi:hypothetical protein
VQGLLPRLNPELSIPDSKQAKPLKDVAAVALVQDSGGQSYFESSFWGM